MISNSKIVREGTAKSASQRSCFRSSITLFVIAVQVMDCLIFPSSSNKKPSRASFLLKEKIR